MAVTCEELRKLSQNVYCDTYTRLTRLEAASALKGAFARVFGSGPSAETLLVLMALSDVETAGWRSMHCYNFGNIKAARKSSIRKTSYSCGEVIDGKEIKYPAGHDYCWFRAYDSADEGAEDFIRLLGTATSSKPNRYAAAWREILSGNVEASVRALGTAGYFTAGIDRYVKAALERARLNHAVAFQSAEPVGAPPLGLPASCSLLQHSEPRLLSVLREGIAGPDVAFLQCALGTAITSTFDVVTDDVVRRWQLSRGLVPDGVVGPLTWAALKKRGAQ